VIKRQNVSADFVVIFSVITMAVCLGAGLARQYPDLVPAPVKGIRQGEKLPNLPEYQWSSHRRTLILGLRVGCPYCAASMEFYQELYRAAPNETHIIAVFSEIDDAPKLDLPDPLRNIEILTGVNLETLGIFGTPTVILADNAGVARQVWRGRLSKESEKQVRAALNGAL